MQKSDNICQGLDFKNTIKLRTNKVEGETFYNLLVINTKTGYVSLSSEEVIALRDFLNTNTNKLPVESPYLSIVKN